MSESSQRKSKRKKLPSLEAATQSPKRLGRRFLFLGGVLLIFAIAIGIHLFLRQDNPPVLPDIPTVNLEGADPEITKVVRIAHDAVVQSPRSAIGWGQYAAVLHAHGFDDAAHICYRAATSGPIA